MKRYIYPITFRAMIASLFLMVIAFSSDVMAQSNNGQDRVMFIQVQDLTPDDFQKLNQALKDDESVKVNQACVPAEVIMFDIPASNSMSLDENFNRVKGAVMESTSLTKVSILAEYSEEDFIERCKMFRMGGEEQ